MNYIQYTSSLLLSLVVGITSFSGELWATAAAPAATTPPAAPKNPLVSPLGVMEDVGKTESLVIGGTMMLCVSYDGKQLLLYDQNSLAANPWSPITLQINDGTTAVDMSKFIIDSVACGSDDTVILLDSTGKAYKMDAATHPTFKADGTYNPSASTKFASLPVSDANKALSLVSVSVGNMGQIWGITSKADAVQYFNNDWVVKAQGTGLDIAVGADGYVVLVNLVGEAFSWNYTTKDWSALPDHPLNFVKIAVGSKDQIYGIVEGGKASQLVNGAWQPLKSFGGKESSGFSDISVNGLGSYGLLDESNDVWMPVAFHPVKIDVKPAAGPVIAVATPVVTVQTVNLPAAPAAAVVAVAAATPASVTPTVASTAKPATGTPAVAVATAPASAVASTPLLTVDMQQINSVSSPLLFTPAQLQAAIAALQAASPESYTISFASGITPAIDTGFLDSSLALASTPAAGAAAPSAKTSAPKGHAGNTGKANAPAASTSPSTAPTAKKKPAVISKRAAAIKAGKIKPAANKATVVIPPKKATPPRSRMVKASVKAGQAATGNKKRPMAQRSMKNVPHPVKPAAAKPAVAAQISTHHTVGGKKA